MSCRNSKLCRRKAVAQRPNLTIDVGHNHKILTKVFVINQAQNQVEKQIKNIKENRKLLN